MDEILASIRKIIADGPGLETPKPNSPERNFSQVSEARASRGPSSGRAMNGEAVAVADPIAADGFSENGQSSHRVKLGFVDHGRYDADHDHAMRQDGVSGNGLNGEPQRSYAGLGSLPGPGQTLEDDLADLLEEQQPEPREPGWAMQLPADGGGAGIAMPADSAPERAAEIDDEPDQTVSADREDDPAQSIEDISVEEALKAIDAQIAAGQALDEGLDPDIGSEETGASDELASDPSSVNPESHSTSGPEVDRSRAEQLLLGTLKGNPDINAVESDAAANVEDLIDHDMRTERHDALADGACSEDASVSDVTSDEHLLNGAPVSDVLDDDGAGWLTIKPEAEAAGVAAQFATSEESVAKDAFPMASLRKPFGLSAASSASSMPASTEATGPATAEQPVDQELPGIDEPLEETQFTEVQTSGEDRVEHGVNEEPQEGLEVAGEELDVFEELVGVPESDVVSPLGALAAGLAASARKPLDEETWTDPNSAGDPTEDVAPNVHNPNVHNDVLHEPLSEPVFEAAEISEVIEPSGSLLLAAAGSGALQPLSGGPTTRSLEDAVSEMLRPLLREWLETNMPRIVENALRIEVAEGLQADTSRERGQ